MRNEDGELMVFYRATLITAATTGHKPTFELQLPNHPSMEEGIIRELLYHTTFQAFVDEDVNSELAVCPSMKKRITKAEWEKEKVIVV